MCVGPRGGEGGGGQGQRRVFKRVRRGGQKDELTAREFDGRGRRGRGEREEGNDIRVEASVTIHGWWEVAEVRHHKRHSKGVLHLQESVSVPEARPHLLSTVSLRRPIPSPSVPLLPSLRHTLTTLKSPLLSNTPIRLPSNTLRPTTTTIPLPSNPSLMPPHPLRLWSLSIRRGSIRSWSGWSHPKVG